METDPGERPAFFMMSYQHPQGEHHVCADPVKLKLLSPVSLRCTKAGVVLTFGSNIDPYHQCHCFSDTDKKLPKVSRSNLANQAPVPPSRVIAAEHWQAHRRLHQTGFLIRFARGRKSINNSPIAANQHMSPSYKNSCPINSLSQITGWCASGGFSVFMPISSDLRVDLVLFLVMTVQGQASRPFQDISLIVESGAMAGPIPRCL